ncbi:ABC-F family ATP-binding cassette domain-containing protein [Alphaproteobacteria bacterium endosymbiont of Tiliacea citrago]|uniref:ABC-F family ATP-binding cassette domain-containing protein n=1 Tax=Alphaproteobacteria bacterium endosymbiont of Tiliacea citrago TaxID=3077944 RepID=UPI00313DC99F
MIIQNLNKIYGSRYIIKNFSYSFPEKEILALVGINGAGKTTLLKLICGQESFEEGTIILPKDKTLGYLPQEPNSNPEETILKECCAGNVKLFQMEKDLAQAEHDLAFNYSEEILENFEHLEESFKKLGGYSHENNAKNMLLSLGFEENQLSQHPDELSGGWRMRLELARLLIKSPDYLILDEPTNHLDLPSIEWLEDYLKKFKGTILFVSHDETLLNNLPDRILHLSGGYIKEYVGNYEDFIEQKESDDANKEKMTNSIQKKVKQLTKFVDRFKAKASLAKQAQNKMKMIQKLNEDIANLGPNIIQPEVDIKMSCKTESSKSVLNFDGEIGYDKHPLQKFSLFVYRGQKIAIIGGNGLGKSTFIKTILEEIPLLSGSLKFGSNVNIGYYAQDQTQSLDPNKSVFENMHIANPEFAEQQLMRVLGSFLFKRDDIHKPIRILSGGEKSRLCLACLLVRDLNLLILDEPTNHLDIMSCQILANAVSNFAGTVIFVSHNRSFIDLASSHLLTFEKNNVSLIEKTTD